MDFNQQPIQNNAQGFNEFQPKIPERNIVVCIILSLVTCGLYTYYWLYVLNEDLRTYTGNKNGTSGGMVILLTLIKECGNLYEYTPLQIKQALTGYGRADKHQIQEMIKLLLGLKSVPRPDDAADALAIALTHAQTSKMNSAFQIK